MFWHVSCNSINYYDNDPTIIFGLHNNFLTLQHYYIIWFDWQWFVTHLFKIFWTVLASTNKKLISIIRIHTASLWGGAIGSDTKVPPPLLCNGLVALVASFFSSHSLFVSLVSSCISLLAGMYHRFFAYFWDKKSRNLTSSFTSTEYVFSNAYNQTFLHNCKKTQCLRAMKPNSPSVENTKVQSLIYSIAKLLHDFVT